MAGIRMHVLVTMERGGASLPEFYSASEVITVDPETPRSALFDEGFNKARQRSFGQAGYMILWQLEPDHVPPGEYHYALTVKVANRNSQGVYIQTMGTSGIYTVSGAPTSRAGLFERAVKSLTGDRPGGEVSVTYWSLAPKYILSAALAR